MSELTNAFLTEVYRNANRIPVNKAVPITTKMIFKAMETIHSIGTQEIKTTLNEELVGYRLVLEERQLYAKENFRLANARRDSAIAAGHIAETVRKAAKARRDATFEAFQKADEAFVKAVKVSNDTSRELL